MYTDPSFGGLLSTWLPVAFAAVSGVVFVFSARIKAFFAQMRRKLRHGEEDSADTQD